MCIRYSYTYRYQWLLYYSKDGQPDASENLQNPYDGIIHGDGYLRICERYSYNYDIIKVRPIPNSYDKTYWWGKKYFGVRTWNNDGFTSKQGVYYETDYYYDEEYGYLSVGVGLATIATVTLIYLLKRKSLDYSF